MNAAANQVKTYRYLRLGMILVMVMLAASILIERRRNDPDCFQTSISAYYHTPVQSVFVAALVTVGACMVIIRGRDVEDIFLNLAGMLATIVAFVPTNGAGVCVSTEVVSARDASANIANNVQALLVVGVISLVLAVYMVAQSWKGLSRGWTGDRALRIAGVIAAAGIVFATWAWYEFGRSSFEGKGTITAHYTAAVGMFVCIGIVVLLNALPSAVVEMGEGLDRTRKYRVAYATVFSGMFIVGVATLVLWSSDWDHLVFAAESAAIILFVVFWIIQTAEVRTIDRRPESVEPGGTA